VLLLAQAAEQWAEDVEIASVNFITADQQAMGGPGSGSP
jgi:hypothetical protein